MFPLSVVPPDFKDFPSPARVRNKKNRPTLIVVPKKVPSGIHADDFPPRISNAAVFSLFFPSFLGARVFAGSSRENRCDGKASASPRNPSSHNGE